MLLLLPPLLPRMGTRQDGIGAFPQLLPAGDRPLRQPQPPLEKKPYRLCRPYTKEWASSKATAVGADAFAEVIAVDRLSGISLAPKRQDEDLQLS